MILCKRYSAEYKDAWDIFVEESKNGTFLLKRDYMDYHSDRFMDYSLMCYDDNTLVGLLPASVHGKEIRSHGGLTYGGLIINRKMTAQKNLLIFQTIIDFFKSEGFENIIYKRVPSIYYSYPSDEDLYSLFRMDAQIETVNISCSILMGDRIRFNERRRRNVKKALKQELTFRQTNDYQCYFNLLSEVLESRHGAKPVHTCAEIELLAERFPDNIKLYASFDGERMLAGVVIYETPLVAHTQYIASSSEGRNCGALDFVFDHLINEVYTEKKYFDFGTSNEEDGRVLNDGLIEQKQEFGGRGIAYAIYRIKI